MHSKRQPKRLRKRWWLVRQTKNCGNFVLAECATGEAANREKAFYRGSGLKLAVREVR